MEDHGRQIEITGKGTYYPNTNPNNGLPRVLAKESSARECGCDSGAGWICEQHRAPFGPGMMAPKVTHEFVTDGLGHTYIEPRAVDTVAQNQMLKEVYKPGGEWGVLPGIKDSGERTTYASGSMRDPSTGKIKWSRITFGPMMRRWAQHLTTAEAKYPDPKPGVPNFMLINTEEELIRYKESAFRHFMAWFHNEVDEDHASAVFFNINGVEIIKEKNSK